MRAVHGIYHFPDDELWVFESYPGSSKEAVQERQSRFSQNPNANRQDRSSNENHNRRDHSSNQQERAVYEHPSRRDRSANRQERPANDNFNRRERSLNDNPSWFTRKRPSNQNANPFAGRNNSETVDFDLQRVISSSITDGLYFILDNSH